MRRIILFIVLAALAAVVGVGALRSRQVAAAPLEQLKARFARKHVPSVDHSRLLVLQQDFVSGREVTTACLSCHTERGKEVMASSHWNWTRREYIPGRGILPSARRTSSTTSASAWPAISKAVRRVTPATG